MRRYETITIIDPDLSEEDRKPVLDRISELITQQDGYLAIFDEWGSRKLAYDIKKKSHGYYVRVDYCGTGALVDEIERFFRIDDRILKYMTVLLDEEADIESIKNEIALAQSEAQKSAVSSKPEPDAISEEPTEPASQIAGESQASEPGDETATEPQPEQPAKDETDTDSEDQPATSSDATAAELAPDKTAEAEADTKSGDAPADASEETLTEARSGATAEAETRSDDGSGDEPNLTADGKKEEQYFP